MERLQRTADAGGRLLKAERLDPGGAGEAQRAAAFLITFDVGRLLVSVDASRGDLASCYLEPGDEAPPGLVDTAEDEPWWRILGAPLVRVWLGDVTPAGGSGRGFRLQFREEDDNPRIITLDADGPLVRVSVEETETRRGAQ
jgi:hypothetical protein